MFSLELCQQVREKVGDCADHADGQAAHLQFLQPCGGVFGVLEGCQNFPDVRQHLFARGGEADFWAAGVKKRQADMVLPLLDLHGDRGRCEVKHFCRF